MSNVLRLDTKVTLPDFTLVSASAGCGKTTALTQRFIQILLSDRIPHNRLKNILAITFTNNAASEMKQRILTVLKQASFGVPAVIGELRAILSLDEEELRKRSERGVDIILDQYTDFQVQTIDSFLSRVLTVSAAEFGITPDVEIVLDTTAILDEAFELLAEELGRDGGKRLLLDRLIDLINQLQTTAFVWNPYAKLAEEVKRLYRLISTHTGELAAEGEILGPHREEILRSLLRIDKEASGTGFDKQTWFTEIVDFARDGDVDAIVGRKLDRPVLKKSKHASFASADTALSALLGATRSAVTRYLEARARSHYHPYVQALALLRASIDEVKRRHGQISLGEASKLLADALTGDLVPEIYFSLGERIHHFLIDEFQDTSPIQWATLRPLIENSLSQQGSLFIVGDTKQSIYTFRGGDWRIMRRMMSKQEFPSAGCRQEQLSINYRSAAAIVEFAQTVFHELVPATVPYALADMSGLASYAQTVPEGAAPGCVRVFSFEQGEGRESPKLIELIQDCRRRGYRYRDIAVLTPRNKDVVEVSRWLNEANVKFISHSSLDIRTRRITGELLALLKFLDSPIDNLAFATFLFGEIMRSDPDARAVTDEVRDYLATSRHTGDAQEPLYAHLRATAPELWERYFNTLFTMVGYLPLYELVSRVYGTFSLMDRFAEEQGTLVKFLGVVQSFEATGSNSLKEFLTFADEDSEENHWDIDVSEGEDAVKIMTVHKAKGLGFPVLIALFYDSVPRPVNLFLEETAGGVTLLRIVKSWTERSERLREIYERESELRQVDELNKLYVAITRAEKEMYVLSVKSKRGEMPSTILPPGGFQRGEPAHTIASPRREEAKAAPLLFVRSGGLPEATNSAPIALAETRRGDFIHAVLALLDVTGEDLTDQLHRAVEQVRSTSGAIMDVERIPDLLQQFLRQREIQEWFAQRPGRKVLNEREIVAANGRLYRIDRLVVDPATATVIDFKTGREQDQYREQVKGYMRLASDLFPEQAVQGFLAYVDLNTLRRVE
jgi:ATP-dependent exoDNAse (exonuclease V) beta subunit